MKLYVIYCEWFNGKSEDDVKHMLLDESEVSPCRVYEKKEDAVEEYNKFKAEVKPAQYHYKPKGKSYYEFEFIELQERVIDEQEETDKITILDRYVSPILEEEEEEL